MSRRKRPTTMSKDSYIKAKSSMLSEFGIDITPDISSELANRYPNEIAIEKYTRKLIMEHLGDD